MSTTMPPEALLLVGGERPEGAAGERRLVFDPATGEAIASVAMATWKVAPALAMGNTVIVKPASDTPLSALRLGELALEAGVPPDAFHVLPGPGETIGGALVSHPLVR